MLLRHVIGCVLMFVFAACSAQAPVADSGTGGGSATGGGTGTGGGGAGPVDAGVDKLLRPGCVVDSDCGAGLLCERAYPGGLCIKECTRTSECTNGPVAGHCTDLGKGSRCYRACELFPGACDDLGSVCVVVAPSPDATPQTPTPFACFPSCFPTGTVAPAGYPTSCGPGYACSTQSLACVPEPLPVATGAAIGDPCDANAACSSSQCILETRVQGPTGFVGGACVNRRPRLSGIDGTLSQDNCPAGAVNFPPGINTAGAQGLCLKRCTRPSVMELRGDCREGYECDLSETTTLEGACVPVNCMSSAYASAVNRGCPATYTCTGVRAGVGLCTR